MQIASRSKKLYSWIVEHIEMFWSPLILIHAIVFGWMFLSESVALYPMHHEQEIRLNLVFYWLYHGNIFHLLLNLASIVLLSIVVLSAGARSNILHFLIWTSSIIAGGIAYAQLTQSTLPLLGCSAAVYGLLTYWCYQAPMVPITWAGLRIPRWALPFASILLEIIISQISIRLVPVHIAWEAHLGGIVVGLMFHLFPIVKPYPYEY